MSAHDSIWNYDLGTLEHVIEVARVLGFCNAAFTKSYGDFMDSPITAKNELTVSAWVKAKEIGATFLEALQAFDALERSGSPKAAQ